MDEATDKSDARVAPSPPPYRLSQLLQRDLYAETTDGVLAVVKGISEHSKQ
jgi:hypothetical protein